MFSPVATVCLVIIAVDMTTTENKMRINDSDDLIMPSALFRQLFLDDKTPSSAGDEGPGDEAAAGCSVGTPLDVIVSVSVLEE